MNIVTEYITIKNEVLTLTNQRALYWEAKDALILSDIHIGKTAHFRRHGIPMPDEILQKDLERLKKMINHFNVGQLLIVGDLFHAETNSDMLTFKSWLKQFENLKLILIKGNHDRQSQRLMDDLNIEVINKLDLGSFTLIHEHIENDLDLFTISGHTHPGVLIKGKGKQKLKLPCYQVNSKQLILPAFSLFTGLNINSKPDDAICYAFTESSIFKF
ncbi:MAG: ligase-associated DNA damage response endonuclease PdeM [Winogradskyella sp.]|uniref:ligase-associated DNA damage response endonuclease PdeM n=1 Tax=Winogradskyella sp. TaxID=1883156 RepID=UPI001805831D|nr:ligase-associated DNA damage response endonuclease PdeM [Winogradskyella sp.]MBT8245230.1 ligase-associated DNA damage response endonuclease PdeM [Winogradskyella sp.]NNK23382.1 ligase-associated DNA damage response endonuclease PdeM [Winogradskyella sp.]